MEERNPVSLQKEPEQNDAVCPHFKQHESLFYRAFTRIESLEGYRDMRTDVDKKINEAIEGIKKDNHERDKSFALFQERMKHLATSEQIINLQLEMKEFSFCLKALTKESEQKKEDEREFKKEVKKTVLGISADSLKEIAKYAIIGYLVIKMGGSL